MTRAYEYTELVGFDSQETAALLLPGADQFDLRDMVDARELLLSEVFSLWPYTGGHRAWYEDCLDELFPAAEA